MRSPASSVAVAESLEDHRSGFVVPLVAEEVPVPGSEKWPQPEFHRPVVGSNVHFAYFCAFVCLFFVYTDSL